jgi:hypothetical protein
MSTTSFIPSSPDHARSAAIPAESPYWVLRVAAALCFIGHGAFGFITKAAWLPYFGVVGIPEDWAWTMMPWVGAVDVTVGMMVLFAPRRIALGYMAVWGFWTALLRPLSGEPIFEALERAGNYGVPLALLLMSGLTLDWRTWLAGVEPGPLSVRQEHLVRRVLQWSTVLLLAGHGALGAVSGKVMLAEHYASVGLPDVTVAVGWFELALAAVIAVRPALPLLLFACAWKLATEALFVPAGAPVWEFVERAGSYGAPLALGLLVLLSRDQGRDPGLTSARSRP